MSSLRNPAKWLLDWLNGGSDNGQVRVTSDTMLGSAAVWYCLNKIAGGVGKMPLEVRQSKADGRGSDKLNKHPAWRLLRDQPNNWQTSDLFKEQIQAHALGWGNGRAAIIRAGGKPTELIPLMPDRTVTLMVMGEKLHVTAPEEDDPLRFRALVQETIEGNLLSMWPKEKLVVLHDRDVLHIVGFGWNGVEGLNIAKVAADSIGIDLSAQRFSRRGMQKGFSGQLMLESPPHLFKNEDEAKAFMDNFRKLYSKEQDSEAIGLLREGMKATVLNMSNKDAEFLEQRRFNRQDIMLWFGVEHIPGDNSSVSYNSLEQKQLAELANCLDRWLVRWENQCDAKLRTEAERRLGKVYHKFNRGTLLATDAQTTQSVLSGYVQSRIVSRNEAREKIDMNPVDGGDEFENPAIDTMQPKPPEDPEDEEDDDDEEPDDTLSSLLRMEGLRIVDGTRQKNFVAFLDSFYARWPLTLMNNGVRAMRAEQLVTSHKEELLAAAGRAHDETELKLTVEEVVQKWVAA